MTGPLTIRTADPLAERGRIAGVLARNLPEAASEERLDWLYLAGPCGPSLVWLAEGDEGTAGTSAAHVREFRVEGEDVRVLNLSDFAVDKGYRTLGPALGLLRATLEAVKSGAYAFSYDVPSESMLALYKRLGYVEVGRMQRWVRPLSLAPVLARRYGLAGRMLAPFADACLQLRDLFERCPKGVRVTPLEGEFGDEFDRFEEQEANRFPVRGVRSAAYLEWRYAQHTMWLHETLCARRGDELVGYLVYREAARGVFSITELGGSDPEIARALVRALAIRGRAAGVTLLSGQLLADSPVVDVFRELRFLFRDDGPGPVVYAPDGAEGLADAARWWFLEGDRDI